MISYWERPPFHHSDVLIIGAGLTGLSTALSLREAEPALRLAVLERGWLPAGASTRNAGFACYGSFTEILDDLGHMPPDRVQRLVGLRREGLAMLRRRLGDSLLDYREEGGHELLGDAEEPLLERLDEVNALLEPVLGFPPYALAQPAPWRFPGKRTLLQIRGEGTLRPGAMMQGLAALARTQGIALFGGCPVEALEEQDGGVVARARDPYSGEPLIFHGGRAAVCTNAFSSPLLQLPQLRPARGQVLITEPVGELPFRGSFHFDRGYYYFREIDGRVLLGGGRQLDPEGETTTAVGLHPLIQQDLDGKLREIILPGRRVQIAARWAGIMAFGADKFPHIAMHGPRVGAGVGLGGMGVALGSAVGQQLAQLLLRS